MDCMVPAYRCVRKVLPFRLLCLARNREGHLKLIVEAGKGGVGDSQHGEGSLKQCPAVRCSCGVYEFGPSRSTTWREVEEIRRAK
eukprot:scaffold2738_cov366-Prasinococcus_capsulatus_cf.AAC.15